MSAVSITTEPHFNDSNLEKNVKALMTTMITDHREFKKNFQEPGNSCNLQIHPYHKVVGIGFFVSILSSKFDGSFWESRRELPKCEFYDFIEWCARRLRQILGIGGNRIMRTTTFCRWKIYMVRIPINRLLFWEVQRKKQLAVFKTWNWSFAWTLNWQLITRNLSMSISILGICRRWMNEISKTDHSHVPITESYNSVAKL